MARLGGDTIVWANQEALDVGNQVHSTTMHD